MTKNSNQTDGSTESKLTEGFYGARRVGLIIAFLVFGVFGVWASTAPIDGASHASGTVIVRSHTRVVQHLEGGIIGDILVEDGSLVQRGDPLIVLDDTQASSQLETVSAQLVTSLSREARLIAERQRLDHIEFPEELRHSDSQAASEMEAQREIFTARRDAREGRIEMLEQRILQFEARLRGLRAQMDSTDSLARSFQEELEEIQDLLADGFSDTNRLRSISRNYDSARSDLAELESDIASTEMQVIELRMEILQIQREFHSEVVSELSEVQNRLKELREQKRSIQDVYSRMVIRSPETGIVNGLQVHTVGGVIPPGNQVAEVVPQGEELIIEARVTPIDIDRVGVGQTASITFPAFSAQTVPRMTGQVIHVAADATYDEQTGTSYYLARIGVEPEELELLGEQSLVPGMPAEVFISSGERTLMQYLLKPLTAAMQRSFIED